MQPRRTDLQTLFAAERAGRHVADSVFMAAFVGHQNPPVVMESAGVSHATTRSAWSVATTCAVSNRGGNRKVSSAIALALLGLSPLAGLTALQYLTLHDSQGSAVSPWAQLRGSRDIVHSLADRRAVQPLRL